MTRPGIEPATSRSQSGRSTTEPLCRSPFNRRFHMTFEENWPRNFRREVIQMYGRTTTDGEWPQQLILSLQLRKAKNLKIMKYWGQYQNVTMLFSRTSRAQTSLGPWKFILSERAENWSQNVCIHEEKTFQTFPHIPKYIKKNYLLNWSPDLSIPNVGKTLPLQRQFFNRTKKMNMAARVKGGHLLTMKLINVLIQWHRGENQNQCNKLTITYFGIYFFHR